MLSIYAGIQMLVWLIMIIIVGSVTTLISGPKVLLPPVFTMIFGIIGAIVLHRDYKERKHELYQRRWNKEHEK